MPANLTPDYERVERTYREALTDAERMIAAGLALLIGSTIVIGIGN